MRYFILLLCIVSLLFSLSGFSAEEPEENIGGILTRLGLSQVQKEEMEEVYRVHGKIEKDLQAKLKEESANLQEELKKKEPKKSRVRGITSNINKINSQLLDNRVEEILKAKDILTPSQYFHFQQMRQLQRLEREAGVDERK